MMKPEEIKGHVTNHFKNHFSKIQTVKVTELNIRLQSLTVEMKSAMEREFTMDEVRDAINSSDGNRALGPDGFNLNFIKKYWNEISPELKEIMDAFHETGRLDPAINCSFITLIPKCANPVNISEYRPICLVGCIYKIVTKILAHRIKQVMSVLVGPNQFAFIQGRQITDSILIANEIVDMLRKNRKEGLLLKLDFEKAYDSVSWEFLERVMTSMNFGERWCKWIKSCISTARLSVLVNGSPGEEFQMKHGLRQGCPLSPFLFILVGEILSRLLYKAEEANFYEGIKIKELDMSVSHLQFADDTLIMMRNSEEGVIKIKRTLKLFTAISGLRINYDKSCLMGVGVKEDSLLNLAGLLGCKIDGLPFKYLGLPVGARANSTTMWEPMIEKFKTKLGQWNNQFLSYGGKVALIQSVMANLPIYYMSIFRMPKKVKSEIEKIQRRFF